MKDTNLVELEIYSKSCYCTYTVKINFYNEYKFNGVGKFGDIIMQLGRLIFLLQKSILYDSQYLLWLLKKNILLFFHTNTCMKIKSKMRLI